MLPLAGAVAVDAWVSHRDAARTASLVQDRLLLGSARVVAEQLQFEDSVFQERIPPAALELFRAEVTDRVYYRLTGNGGQLLSGYDELAAPAATLTPETPLYFDTRVRDSPVRVVAFLQPVVSDGGPQAVLVEIAQTMNGHAQMTRSLWLDAIAQQLVILALASALVLIGLRHGLKPLLGLSAAVRARDPGTLEPLEIEAVPVELAPLVLAINEYARQLDQYLSAQRIFVQNAAHQLRTPLALLNIQLSYAIRSDDARVQSQSLVAIRQTVHGAVRLVNQMLMLSAAEAHRADREADGPVSLDAVVQGVLQDLAAQAQARDIDLGFEMNGTVPANVQGHPVALREMVVNLVDNAIRYTQPGGVVTARITVREQKIELVVEDNGPGIAAAHRERIFERFYRINDRDSSGCGLGLSIVREFAGRMGGSIELRVPPSGEGTAMVLTLICAAPASHASAPASAAKGTCPPIPVA
ncbi:sensor histidine kinase [Variovorax sp. SRS16]|uniref:sensor histidine kinase n=1 Tax=Variovorax sp. SRS16 TaxID=282217 RepID=UPI001E3F024D|nr:sensor histidine kinase [Variovorax sp. SRS16]